MHDMFKDKKNGWYIIHLSGERSIVVRVDDGKPASANLDNLDPEGFKGDVDVEPCDVVAVEEISESRLFYMREMATRKARINDIGSALQLHQLIQNGMQAGIVHKPEPVRNQPPVNEPLEETDEEEYEPLGSPASMSPPAPSPMPPQIVGQKKPYDGVVVQIPRPGNR